MTAPHTCQYPGCRNAGLLVRLPMSERFVWVCWQHRGARFIARMRELLA